MTNRCAARQLAAESIQMGRPLAWFETSYAQAAGDQSAIPWADLTVNSSNLASWLDRRKIDGWNKTALVIGCGLDDDAETIASLGFCVTAVDISPTCIEWRRRRFPESAVEYIVANLFDPLEKWNRSFNFVFEAYTLAGHSVGPLHFR